MTVATGIFNGPGDDEDHGDSDGLQDDAPSEQEPSTWDSVDLALLRDKGLADAPPPEILTMVDGRSLLYAGKIHSFNGESESGKSWAACLACLGEIRRGRNVTYLDFEDDAPTVVGRMLAIGARWDELLAHFDYRSPAEPFSLEALASITGRCPVLVVVDGVTEAMTLHDLDPDKNRDSAKFIKMVVRPLAAAGAAVAQVDHVTKNPEARGRYAIGAQHKRAAVTGAMYTFSVTKPFGRGMSGVVAIGVHKDKPGHVRRGARGGHVADMVIDSNGDGSVVNLELRAPVGGDRGSFRPTVLMERVSRCLEDKGEAGLTRNSLKAAVTGNKDHIGLAAEVLAAEGYVAIDVKGQTKHHVSVKPYRREEDPLDLDNRTQDNRTQDSGDDEGEI